jgi:hypothetical protein
MPYCVIEVGFGEPGGGFVLLSSLGSVICEEHAAKNIEQIKKTFFILLSIGFRLSLTRY